jgi:hypothetical protein
MNVIRELGFVIRNLTPSSILEKSRGREFFGT